MPPNDDAYTPLSQGRCTDLQKMVAGWVDANKGENGGIPEEDILLFSTAAKLCLTRQQVAPDDLAALRRMNLTSQCSRRVVRDWVLDVAAIQAADPAVTIRFVASPGLSPCPIALPPDRDLPPDVGENYGLLTGTSQSSSGNVNTDCTTLYNATRPATTPPQTAPPGVDFLSVLYHGAAAACLGHWSEARDAFDRLPPPGPSVACPDRVVYDWLKVLVKAYKATNAFTSPPGPPHVPPVDNRTNLLCLKTASPSP
ncbi:MAG TPA: hypothetical protein VII47_08735 [Actinomycetota bacterium]|jgi:hypothetical protein